MAGLPVVDCPALDGVAEGALEVGDVRATYPDLDQLTLVNEYLEVVTTALCEYLRAQSGLEPVTIVRFAHEVLLIQKT